MLTKTINKLVRSIITGERFEVKSATGSVKTMSTPDSLSNGYQSYYVNNMMRIPYLMQQDLYSISLSEKAKGGICFGTGTAVPTEDDYTVTQRLLSSSEAGVTMKLEQDETSCTGTYSIVNNSTENITITEVALFGCSVYNSSGSGYCYLIDRTLLAEPLVIPPEEMGRVVYTVTIT